MGDTREAQDVLDELYQHKPRNDSSSSEHEIERVIPQAPKIKETAPILAEPIAIAKTNLTVKDVKQKQQSRARGWSSDSGNQQLLQAKKRFIKAQEKEFQSVSRKKDQYDQEYDQGKSHHKKRQRGN